MAQIALFCTLHAASAPKRDRILTHLRSLAPYYHTRTFHCTTWTYFKPTGRTPFHRLPNGQTLRGPGSATDDTVDHDCNFVIASFEIYTTKTAFQQQLDASFFQRYHAIVKEEGLYARDEELVAWYPAGGFVARNQVSPAGDGFVVVVALARLKDAAKRGEAVAIMSDLAAWIKENEAETLSYVLFTRPKAQDEVLVFERYTCRDAFERHRETGRFKATSQLMGPLLSGITLAEYVETDGSFVSNVEGGGSGLESKI